MFTPYRNAWLKKLEPFFLKSYPVGKYRERLAAPPDTSLPALNGTSRLSVHLRFGTVSVRELARAAYLDAGRGAQIWLNELVWRDFYFMILYYHPPVVRHAFRRESDALEFPNDKSIHAPWLMTPAQQNNAGVIIGRDYPAPVVDHAAARQRTLKLYKSGKR